MKKRLFILLLVVLLTTGTVSAGFAYFGFVSQTIYEESTAHLSEIFHQANQTLYNLVSVNWSRMRMWVPYLEKTESETDIIAYVNQAREEINFTDFYFICLPGACPFYQLVKCKYQVLKTNHIQNYNLSFRLICY